jgi:hypothetical protein
LKLHKNTGPKSLIFAATAGLFVGLFSLIRTNPEVSVDSSAETQAEAPDYDQVFRTGLSNADSRGTQDDSVAGASTRTHTRTRGS